MIHTRLRDLFIYSAGKMPLLNHRTATINLQLEMENLRKKNIGKFANKLVKMVK